MIAPQLNLSQFDYFSKSFAIVNGRDLIGGIIKSVFFGFLVGSIGCYIGMSTTGGTQGVGNSTTRSVVLCSIMVIFFDFILTKLLWIIEHAFLMGGL